MKNYVRQAYLLFGLAALADILCLNFFPGLRYFTKPLLMPLLMLAYFLETRPLTELSRYFLLALFFSWVGDVLLMFDKYDPVFFMAGLAGFLAAHVTYILYFRKIVSDRPSFLKKRPVMLLAVFVYVFELLYILWPDLGGMRIPVLVYAIVIGTMLSFALWQYGKLEEKTARLYMGGAFFFVLSDTLLAINKFKRELPLAGILIMVTYILAQYMLAKGSARHLRRDGINS